MEMQAKTSTKLVALAVVGTVFTGVLGLFGALFAFLNVDAAGVGISLIASALSFGFLATALLRE